MCYAFAADREEAQRGGQFSVCQFWVRTAFSTVFCGMLERLSGSTTFRELAVSLMVRNVGYAIRGLMRSPGFTASVVLTLALGIGANSAVFSAMEAVLFRPLPFPDADRLMRLSHTGDLTQIPLIAPVRLEDWDELNSTFQAVTGYYTEDVSEISGEYPERVRRANVAPRFLEVWGVAPALGRDFSDAEHRFGGPPAVLISDGYWRTRFGGDPGVLDREVRLATATFSIVGVMPASFLFPDREVNLWFPVPTDAPFTQDRRSTWYIGVGRLDPNVLPEQARADLAEVQTRLANLFPETDGDLQVRVEPLKETMIGSAGQSLWLLFGAVSVLLLIACTNVVSLLLSRAAQRSNETAIRFSLGASRTSVATQMITETAVLALAGACVGLLVAVGASAGFRAYASDLPRMDEISLDGRILIYTMASTLVVAFGCAVIPAVRATRAGVSGLLAEAGRTQVSRRNPLQWLLVGVQVSLAVTLLAGAGLLLRSFQELSRVDLGFEPEGVLAFQISGGFAETANYDALISRIDRTLDELSALPEVESASTAAFLPGVPFQYETELELVDGLPDGEDRIVAETRIVSPDYFTGLRIPLVAGEPCRRQADGSVETMVNRSFAERFFPNSSPIGRRFVGRERLQGGRIAGIVADAREGGIDRDPAPAVYWCFSAPGPTPYFLVRTRADIVAVASAVRQRVSEIEPLRSVYDITPLEAHLGNAFTDTRLRMALFVFFAITALFLACMGLYGTLSYVVGLRGREVGLRLALGAVRSDIVTQFVMKGLRVVGLACALGLALSLGLTRALSGMLFGVAPTDPVTLAAVILLVVSVSTFACFLPAARAAVVEPMRVLREE